MLEEEHGVVAADRRAQEAVRVERVGRHDDAQSRDVRHEDDARLRVVDGAAADVSADRHADDDGRGERVARAPADVRELVVDLHVRRPDVVVELDLDDGLQAPHRHPDRAADDVRLGERRVEDARPCRRAAAGSAVSLKTPPLPLHLVEHFLARRVGDVLAEDDDARDRASSRRACRRSGGRPSSSARRPRRRPGRRRERGRRGIDVRASRRSRRRTRARGARAASARSAASLTSRVDLLVQPLEVGAARGSPRAGGTATVRRTGSRSRVARRAPPSAGTCASSSESEWLYGRMTCAWTKRGALARCGSIPRRSAARRRTRGSRSRPPRRGRGSGSRAGASRSTRPAC